MKQSFRELPKKSETNNHYDEDVDRKLLCAQYNQMEQNERDRIDRTNAEEWPTNATALEIFKMK